ncbi:hypothetical protein ABIA31_007596 [Catenulispora sp. MAP5-51]|uniref:DUF6807 domain-containing protein n=1 Tax=Catenulispora sp. MAP5-51 TaxID=3156298 RepID=UPI0035177BE6
MTASDSGLRAAPVVSANGDEVSVRVGAVEVLRARFADEAIPARECRAPYLHPIRTLAGGVVTGHRPYDHRWHKGLTMAVPYVAGSNFWGGPSYVDGRGYVDLGDVGRIATNSFEVLPDGTVAAELAWIGADGAPVLAERRTFAVRSVDPEAGCWTLEFRSELRTFGAGPVAFKSPTVLGRDRAGYCGFFWRGPRSFTGGRVLAANGLEGAEALMGERARWLAYIGEFDERDGFATLVFVPDGAAPEWFVRSEDYPGVNPSLAFRQPRVLAAGERLAVGYRMVIADGAWSRGRIGELLDRGATPPVTA